LTVYPGRATLPDAYGYQFERDFDHHRRMSATDLGSIYTLVVAGLSLAIVGVIFYRARSSKPPRRGHRDHYEQSCGEESASNLSATS